MNAAQTKSQGETVPAAPLMSLRLPSPRPYAIAAAVATLAWTVGAWIGTQRYYDAREVSALAGAETAVAAGIADIATGLRRNLAVYHGIPATLARDVAIRRALARFPPTASPAAQPREHLRANWQDDAEFAALNRQLAASTGDIPAFSVIWVMNAAGDCIAASNAGTATSFVGTNYADREYFRATRDGRKGNQFAVGRVTNIPGLFFSAPVFDGPRFLGTVAVKIDLPYLAFWVNQANAFVSDPYGVIVMAQDKRLEMQALPGSTVQLLTAEQRLARYRRADIPPLAIAPWGDPPHPLLKRLRKFDEPMLMASQSIPEEGLDVTVMQPVPQAAGQAAGRSGLFISVAGLGVIVIVLTATGTYYVGNRQRTRRYREQQAQVEYLATHDTLTGLFNRAMIEQLTNQGIALSARTGRRLAAMFVDLDLFKTINDSMGHEAGDEVLREVALRLRNTVRAADAVVRQGGDEFLVILNDVGGIEDVAHVAQKLINAVAMPMRVREVRVQLTASVGIALYPEDGDTASMLVRNADAALYHAKESGRADYRFYHGSMNADALARLALESALRDALERGELRLCYQPQYDLVTSRVIGCEALVRWHHPKDGILAPDSFIPVAEKTGLIVALDEWVVEAACRQMQEWRRRLGVDLHIAVNVSAAHFRKPGLVDRVRRALAATGLPPTCLELELTESAVMENSERAAAMLDELKAMGVRLAIDDFGTGYSSLAYLKRFAADKLKIDRRFVRDLDADANDRAIVLAIVQMAQAMNCAVIAEGVENARHVRVLEELGCTLVQGYWLSKPLYAANFEAYLARAEAPEAS